MLGKGRVRSTCSLDYETYSELDLKSVGLSRYIRDLSTAPLFVAYKLDSSRTTLVDLTQDSIPAELKEALLDPEVEKWAFNAAVERLATRHLFGIDTPYENWRCTMVLANLQSFSGGLLQVGQAMGIEGSLLKDTVGTKLIKMFSMPQKITRNSALERRTRRTNPEDWQQFGDYCLRDVDAEDAIKQKLLRFPIREEDWLLYEIDQRINDRGLPVNRRFVEQAHKMSDRRKKELKNVLAELTGLANPNSTPQLLPWLKDRGYPFSDLQKNTVSKVLGENVETQVLHTHAVSALKLREQTSKASVEKFPAILLRLDDDNRLRHCFQYAGAQRTARWSGRGPQPHNLTRTPKCLEADGDDASRLEAAAEFIEAYDYDMLELLVGEPLVGLAGSVRSSFQAEKGKELVVCDLSAIESAVLAWLSGCVRLLAVFTDGRDPYRDFGTELYHKAYDLITKAERTICKPAVLGCGYQLGGGELRDGKRTGLWGYAENMGIQIPQEEAKRQVALFRRIYLEIPDFWKALEKATTKAMGGETATVNGLLTFAMKGPYMTIRLPSGRHMYYYKPRMVERTFEGRDGPYTRTVFSYMGRGTTGNAWMRVFSSGGKLAENVTQAVARDVLGVGVVRAEVEGFHIIGTVHDEIITMQPIGDNHHTPGLLRSCMMAPITWARGLPLGAAGYSARVYRKD